MLNLAARSAEVTWPWLVRAGRARGLRAGGQARRAELSRGGWGLRHTAGGGVRGLAGTGLGDQLKQATVTN